MSLRNHIIKEVFEELLLKQRHFEPEYNNFLKVQPLLLAGKECLAVFIELLREVRSVAFNSSNISMELMTRSLNSDSFPLGLWKDMALFIPKLTVNTFDKDYQMEMIKTMEHSTRLRKIEAVDDISPEAWRYLLNTSVNEISAPLRSLIDIEALEEHFYANIGSVEALYYIDDALLKEFLLNLRIPCRSLKIQRMESFFSFSEIIFMERVISPTVEKLELRFNVTDHIPMVDLNLTRLFEAIQLSFPALKELKMELETDEGAENACGDNFVPHLGFLQFVVNELTNQIQKANIQYKLCFDYCRTDYIDWPNDNVFEMELAFTGSNFVKEDESEISQKWVHSNQLSESKDLKITYYLEEVEMNSEIYADMMGDLGIDNFYSYDDNDYDDFDAENYYDDAGLDDY